MADYEQLVFFDEIAETHATPEEQTPYDALVDEWVRADRRRLGRGKAQRNVEDTILEMLEEDGSMSDDQKVELIDHMYEQKEQRKDAPKGKAKEAETETDNELPLFVGRGVETRARVASVFARTRQGLSNLRSRFSREEHKNDIDAEKGDDKAERRSLIAGATGVLAVAGARVKGAASSARKSARSANGSVGYAVQNVIEKADSWLNDQEHGRRNKAAVTAGAVLLAGAGVGIYFLTKGGASPETVAQHLTPVKSGNTATEAGNHLTPISGGNIGATGVHLTPVTGGSNAGEVGVHLTPVDGGSNGANAGHVYEHIKLGHNPWTDDKAELAKQLGHTPTNAEIYERDYGVTGPAFFKAHPNLGEYTPEKWTMVAEDLHVGDIEELAK